MIKIIQADAQPYEDECVWSYDIRDIDEVFENHADGTTFLYWRGRLYEEQNNE